MTKKFQFLVFIGRFQPLHEGHAAVIREALRQAERVIICIGSHRVPRNLRNPWTWEERAEMIRRAFPQECAEQRILPTPILDFTYSDAEWVQNVRQAVNSLVNMYHVGADEPTIGLIGHSKDHSSYYLNSFPSWESVNVPGYVDGRLLSATEVRDMLFANEVWHRDRYKGLLHPEVEKYLHMELPREIMDKFSEELRELRAYREKWGKGPFTAVDALVLWNSHVLLVERGQWPGKGLWALPGGFLNPEETLLQGARRELEEETGLIVRWEPSSVKVFDDPHRAARGRIISHTHCWRIPTSEPTPRVKGADDAARAFWCPISELAREKIFADHFHIIRAFL